MQLAAHTAARPRPLGFMAMSAAPAGPPAEPARTGIVRKLSKGESPFAEGNPAIFYDNVVSGSIRSYKLTSDGRRQICAFHLPGDIFGLCPGKEHLVCAEAISPTSVITYHRSHLDMLAEEARLVKALMLSLERAQNHALLLGRKSAMEPIAAFLLDMAVRMPRGELDLEA